MWGGPARAALFFVLAAALVGYHLSLRGATATNLPFVVSPFFALAAALVGHGTCSPSPGGRELEGGGNVFAPFTLRQAQGERLASSW